MQNTIKGHYFITGTDTGIGKTVVSVKLLEEAKRARLKTLALKPLSSGARLENGERLNDDAVQLQKNATIPLTLSDINPFAFIDEMAPHLAARHEGVKLEAKAIAKHILNIKERYPSDLCVIEGSGGILVPLNRSETLADVMEIIQIPTILVVGIRLGCLNHARLSMEALKKRKLPIAGWIANCLDDNCKERIALVEDLAETFQQAPLRVYESM